MEYNNIILGSKEVVIGGWGEYEIKKRHLRSVLNNDNYDKYYSKKYIYPQNVIDSVLGGGRHNSSYDAINKFINILRTRELNEHTSFDNIWIMPTLTSSKLSTFTKEDLYDMDEMQKMNIFLKDYIDMMNINIPLENLNDIPINNQKPVHLSNNAGIIDLENQMIPIINIIEQNLAIFALNCDNIRKAITHRKINFDAESDSTNSDILSDVSTSGSDSESESESEKNSEQIGSNNISLSTFIINK